MSNTLQSQQHHQLQQKQTFSVSFWSLICQFFENVLISNCPAFLLIGPFHLPMTSVSFTITSISLSRLKFVNVKVIYKRTFTAELNICKLGEFVMVKILNYSLRNWFCFYVSTVNCIKLILFWNNSISSPKNHCLGFLSYILFWFWSFKLNATKDISRKPYRKKYINNILRKSFWQCSLQ